jgi:hypothetical protein
MRFPERSEPAGSSTIDTPQSAAAAYTAFVLPDPHGPTRAIAEALPLPLPPSLSDDSLSDASHSDDDDDDDDDDDNKSSVRRLTLRREEEDDAADLRAMLRNRMN